MIPLIGTLINTAAGAFVKKFIDEPAKQADAERELISTITSAVTEANKAQMEVNKVEAEHKSIFVAGWRPFIGWICGIGIGFNFVFRPLLNWALLIAQSISGQAVPILPELEITQLITLISGMLGLGTMRMFEKFKGVSRESDPKRG